MRPVVNDLVSVLRQLHQLSYMRETTPEQGLIIHDVERLTARALYWVTKDRSGELADVNQYLAAHLSEDVVRQLNGNYDRTDRADVDPGGDVTP